MPESIASVIAKTYDPDTAYRLMEQIASGQTIVTALKEPGMPSRATFYRWISAYPELNKAYEAARELSAQSFEEAALELANELIVRENEFTGVMVRRYEVAMAQLRWSAARRDPKRYGQKQEASLIVPIQINTSLNLNEDGLGVTAEAMSPDQAYHIEAVVNQPAPIADLAAIAYDVPEEVPVSAIPGKKIGRPVGSFKGHKTASQIRATLASRARKKKE